MRLKERSLPNSRRAVSLVGITAASSLNKLVREPPNEMMAVVSGVRKSDPEQCHTLEESFGRLNCKNMINDHLSNTSLLTFSQLMVVRLSTQPSLSGSVSLSWPHKTTRRCCFTGWNERGVPRSGGDQGSQSKLLGITGEHTHTHTPMNIISDRL